MMLITTNQVFKVINQYKNASKKRECWTMVVYNYLSNIVTHTLAVIV